VHLFLIHSSEFLKFSLHIHEPEMSHGPLVLIVNEGCGEPILFVIPGATAEELRYLKLLEGMHDEDIDEEDKERCEAYCYVTHAIGRRPLSYLETIVANYKKITTGGRKWVDYRVETFAEVNNKYGGSIAGVFCINHSDV
jgi:hypothetical protein